MFAVSIAILVFVIVAVALLAGTRVANRLPSSHLDGAARTSAHIGISMMATLAALVLGLLINAAQSSFNRRTAEVVAASTLVVLMRVAACQREIRGVVAQA